MSEPQENPDQNVVVPDTTEEHQVGETEQGEAIMGVDRGNGGDLDNEFAAADAQANENNNNDDENTAPADNTDNNDEAQNQQQQDNNVGTEVSQPPQEENQLERQTGEEQQQQQQADHDQQQQNNTTTTTTETQQNEDQSQQQQQQQQKEPVLPVRVVSRPGGFATVLELPLDTKVSAITSGISRAWSVDRSHFRLLAENAPLEDSDYLKNVFVFSPRFTQNSVSEGQITEYHEVYAEAEFDLLPDHLRVLAPGDDVIRVLNVVIRADEGGEETSLDFMNNNNNNSASVDRVFKLATVRALERKPFLGGYRNIKTDQKYHDAACQTISPSEIRRNTIQRQSKKELITRMTQTQGKTRACQTTSECGTQMPRTDLHVTEEYDRVVIALPYFSAEQLLSVHVQKTIRIQSLVRGWRARKIATELRESRAAEEAELAAEDDRRRELHRKKRQEEVNRRVHPRTQKDFAILYNELEAWRLQEGQRIREAKNVPEVEKALALQELLKKETKLLQTIDRLQLQANQENRTKRVQTTLDKMAAPKVWGGKGIQVETPFTTRAKELRDLYNGLLLKGLSIDERLDVLLHVKWTVKEFNCSLTRDIVELVDREADLLNRGRKDNALDSLRNRTANLFLQFCETPEFNPEAINFQRAPLEFASRPQIALTKR